MTEPHNPLLPAAAGDPARSAKPVFPRRLKANRRNTLLSTGPRTAAGKQILGRNSLKHGLFASQLIVPEADGLRAEQKFRHLLTTLRHHYQPADPMAAWDVEELAVMQWMKRRALRGLSAGIGARLVAAPRRRTEQAEQARREVHLFAGADKAMRETTPEGVESLLRILADVRADVSKEGTLSETGYEQLGENFPAVSGGFVDRCGIYRLVAEQGPEQAEEETQKVKDLPTAEQCAAEILRELDQERDRLVALKERLDGAAAAQREGDRLDAVRPDAVDGVLGEHYARWQRQADRIRDRLDRQRRERSGQPLPPTLEVNVRTAD